MADESNESLMSSNSNGSEDETSIRNPLSWIQQKIENDADPRAILKALIPNLQLPEHVNEMALWRLVLEIITEPRPRKVLPHVNSIEQVISLIRESRNIIVLTGAGVSVSCGIPDFRSRDGIYARLSKDYPDLPDPQAMFDISYFKTNQWPFFKFAKEIYPGQFTPSLCHRFIAYLDKTGRLLRNYSQNIDTLEQVAGIKNVIQCHGSFATASCMNCKQKVEAKEIKEDIFNERIPACKQCVVDTEGKINVLKPDIVFFGESLPEAFHQQIELDKDKADMLIVIGSSLKVRPVSLIPNLIKPNAPQVLINREPLDHTRFDVELYGNCDDVICELCEQLGDDWLDLIKDYKKKSLDDLKMQELFHSAEAVEATNKGTYEDVNLDGDEKVTMEDSNTNLEMGGCRVDVDSKNNSSDISGECHCVKLSCNDEEATNMKCSCKADTDVKNNEKPSFSGSFKRKSDDSSIPRKKSNIGNQESTSYSQGQPIYYLSIPPNRYIFHGAEISLEQDDSESDSESDITNNEEMDCLPKSVDTENNDQNASALDANL